MNGCVEKFSKLRHSIASDKSLTYAQKIILSVIENYSRGLDGCCTASFRQILEDIGSGDGNERWLHDLLLGLRDQGHIRIEGVSRSRKIYPVFKEIIPGENNPVDSLVKNPLLGEIHPVDSLVKNPLLGEIQHEVLGEIQQPPLIPPIYVNKSIRKEEEEESISKLPPAREDVFVSEKKKEEPSAKDPVVAPLLLPSSSLSKKFRKYKNIELTEQQYEQICKEYGEEFVKKKMSDFDNYPEKSAEAREKFSHYEGKHYETIQVWCEKDYKNSVARSEEKKKIYEAAGIEKPLPPSAMIECVQTRNRNKKICDQIISRYKEIEQYIEKQSTIVFINAPGRKRFRADFSDVAFGELFENECRKALSPGSYDLNRFGMMANPQAKQGCQNIA
jgi:hypothetical protein